MSKNDVLSGEGLVQLIRLKLSANVICWYLPASHACDPEPHVRNKRASVSVWCRMMWKNDELQQHDKQSRANVKKSSPLSTCGGNRTASNTRMHRLHWMNHAHPSDAWAETRVVVHILVTVNKR
jgi:hypothetical protein